MVGLTAVDYVSSIPQAEQRKSKAGLTLVNYASGVRCHRTPIKPGSVVPQSFFLLYCVLTTAQSRRVSISFAFFKSI